eukprot:1147972-Pelagomonas_calceolata.AAC.6
MEDALKELRPPGLTTCLAFACLFLRMGVCSATVQDICTRCPSEMSTLMSFCLQVLPYVVAFVPSLHATLSILLTHRTLQQDIQRNLIIHAPRKPFISSCAFYCCVARRPQQQQGKPGSRPCAVDCRQCSIHKGPATWCLAHPPAEKRLPFPYK